MDPSTDSIDFISSSSNYPPNTLVICCVYIGDYTTHFWGGIIISHYKDFYEPISIMECHKGFEGCSFVLVQTLRRIVFFWRRLILVPIHMFPTFVFVATDKPVHVSNNCSNTCFGSCIYFVPPKQKQPTQQTARQTILSTVKRLGFLHLLYHGLVYRTHWGWRNSWVFAGWLNGWLSFWVL